MVPTARYRPRIPATLTRSAIVLVQIMCKKNEILLYSFLSKFYHVSIYKDLKTSIKINTNLPKCANFNPKQSKILLNFRGETSELVEMRVE